MSGDLRPVLRMGLRRIRAGQIGDALVELMSAVERQPSARGAADAFFYIGGLYMQSGQLHRQEIYCLLAHHARATAIAPHIPFDSLVNLTRACINLKSFREAWHWGLIAERIRDDDSDLLANMVATSMLLGEPDAAARADRLRAIDPAKMVYLAQMLQGKDPTFRATRNEDGAALVCRFEETGGDLQQLLDLVGDLERRPDCMGAARCWRLLAEAYRRGMQEQSGSTALLFTAGLVAAAGKALNAAGGDAPDDIELRHWYHAALAALEPASDDTPVAAAKPERDGPRSAALLTEFEALASASLAQRRATVQSLRARVDAEADAAFRDELNIALALALGLVAFALIDEHRDGRAEASESVDRLSALRHRLGDRADELVERFTGDALAESQAHALSELAFHHRNAGDLVAAERALWRAVEASPLNPKLRCNLAHLLLDRVRLSDRRNSDGFLNVLEQLEEAQRSGPYASTMRVLRGLLLLPGVPHDVERRAHALRRAIELGIEPEVEPAAARRARALRRAIELALESNDASVSAGSNAMSERKDGDECPHRETFRLSRCNPYR